MLSFARSNGNSGCGATRALGDCSWPANLPEAPCLWWATAQWDVQAHVLSQQDDECAQSKLFGEPLAKLDQGLGQC